MNTKNLTVTGIARMLARGIRANYAPENQQAEIERLVEYLQDLAMSRGVDVELSQTRQDQRRAENDGNLLDAIACELEATI